MEQPSALIYLVAGGVAAVGFAVAIWPSKVVAEYERMAAKSHDALARTNQAIFDPTKRQDNAFTFRLVGIGGIVMGLVVALLVFAARM
jgi:hypothetical protein